MRGVVRFWQGFAWKRASCPRVARWCIRFAVRQRKVHPGGCLRLGSRSEAIILQRFRKVSIVAVGDAELIEVVTGGHAQTVKGFQSGRLRHKSFADWDFRKVIIAEGCDETFVFHTHLFRAVVL